MKVWLARNAGTFVPTDDEGRALLARLGLGECFLCEVIRPRSVAWHRMYFGICRSIGDNQDPVRDESSIDYELRIRAGHYDVMFVDQQEIRVPRRIAFHKLTHDEWVKLWPSIDLAIRERFGEEFAPQGRDIPNG